MSSLFCYILFIKLLRGCVCHGILVEVKEQFVEVTSPLSIFIKVWARRHTFLSQYSGHRGALCDIKLCEFKAGLVCIVSSRTAWKTGEPVLKIFLNVARCLD